MAAMPPSFTYLTVKMRAKNDLHITAHASSDGFVVVTNNLREFERVADLRILNRLVEQ